MSYEVDLYNRATGTQKTIIVDDCADMDACLDRVHRENPEDTIEFIGETC